MDGDTAMTGDETQSLSRRIGRFEVLRYLAAGGMADLYLVREQGRREPLVLKRVQQRYLGNERVVAMFRDEAQIGSLLLHPHIVRVYDIGEADGHPFIAMEYIPGHDLVHTLSACTAKRMIVPRDLGVALCAHVARGLAYAHELRGPDGHPLEIVHCDISPGNIMLSWRGAVKLVDFGVARAHIPLHCRERGVAGKYNYMAPEQIVGARVDRRADLFSLGVILHELTCGQRLFRGRPEAVMHQVVDGPIPPPRQIFPDYPAELEAIVMRALERDPARRYPTAEALRVDLVAFLSRSPRAHGKRELGRFLRAIFGPPGTGPGVGAGDDEPTEADGPDGPDSQDGPGANETVDFLEVARRAPPLPPPPPPSAAPRPPPPLAADADPTTEAVFYPGGPGQADAQEDREESLLTRCDNPILATLDQAPLPVQRDPDRTSFLRGPGRGPHTGGVTTHMLGEGRTQLRPAGEPVPVPVDEEGRTGLVAGPAGEKALRAPWTKGALLTRTLVLTLFTLLSVMLAYYITQR